VQGNHEARYQDCAFLMAIISLFFSKLVAQERPLLAVVTFVLPSVGILLSRRELAISQLARNGKYRTLLTHRSDFHTPKSNAFLINDLFLLNE